MYDNGSGTDDAALADRHAGQDGDATAKPGVVANSDRIGRLYGFAPVEIVHRMLWREQLTVRSDEHMVANGDDSPAEERTVVVDEHMLPDVVAAGMVAEKRRADRRRVRDARCYLPQQRAVIGRGQRGPVKRQDQFLGVVATLFQLWVINAIELLRAHLLKFCFHSHRVLATKLRKNIKRTNVNSTYFVTLPQSKHHAEMRRTIILLVGLLLCLYTKAQMHSYDTSFTFSQTNFVDTISIEVVDDQIYIMGTAGGRPCRFNLDTGSSQGSIYMGSGIQGLRPLGNVVSRDAAGNLDTVAVVELPSLTIGKLTLQHYVASVFRPQTTRRTYDAILGFDLLNKGLCCKIDARRGYIILTDRRDYFDREPGVGLHYRLKWFVPYVLVSPFKRHTDEVLFDTGSPQLFTMNKESFDVHAYKSKNVESQVEERVNGSFTIGQLGAERPSEVVFMKLDRLRWDTFSFKNVKAMTTQGASRIGASILRYGTVIINGFRHKIFFQPYEGGDNVEVNNKTYTVAYVPDRDGRPVVGLLTKSSDEYRAGLRQGDTIMAIDGKAVATFADFRRYPFVEGQTYTLTVRGQNGMERQVPFTR